MLTVTTGWLLKGRGEMTCGRWVDDYRYPTKALALKRLEFWRYSKPTYEFKIVRLYRRVKGSTIGAKHSLNG
jgi:hypothetical protein